MELPPNIAKLPVDDRGYPIPWFVAWVDGKPDFRLADPKKVGMAFNQGRCWVCGHIIYDVFNSFVVGPMCSINKTSGEPPSHRECAEFSATHCPFLITPARTRNKHDLPEGSGGPIGGIMIERNPGVTLVWTALAPRAPMTHPQAWFPFTDGEGGLLFNMGTPVSWSWYKEGRSATREEVMESIASGLPALAKLAIEDGPTAELDLAQKVERAKLLLPPREKIL